MGIVPLFMQIALGHDILSGWHVLKRALIVIMLAVFGMAASAYGDIGATTLPIHLVQVEFAPADGPDHHHGGRSDHCQQTAGACIDSGTAAMAPSPCNATAPDVGDLPQYFQAGWSPLVQPWTTATPPPPSLPLYLQTSRLLI